MPDLRISFCLAGLLLFAATDLLGQASITSEREFRYPIADDYEPPQVPPPPDGDDDSPNTGIIIPATPTSFDTRMLGKSLRASANFVSYFAQNIDQYRNKEIKLAITHTDLRSGEGKNPTEVLLHTLDAHRQIHGGTAILLAQPGEAQRLQKRFGAQPSSRTSKGKQKVTTRFLKVTVVDLDDKGRLRVR